MRRLFLTIALILIQFLVCSISFVSKAESGRKILEIEKTMLLKADFLIHKKSIDLFYVKYPKLKPYEKAVVACYESRNFHLIWFDDKDLPTEFSRKLYSCIKSLKEEGIESSMECQEVVDAIFNSDGENSLSATDSDIMLTNAYVYYVQKVFFGIDIEKIKKMAWFLPQKEHSYNLVLDSLSQYPEMFHFAPNLQFVQYYKLRSALKKYRDIEKRGEWTPIVYDSTIQYYKPFDSSATISQIRHRLYIMGDLEKDSKSPVYDNEMMEGVLRYKKRNGNLVNYFITPWQIQQLNLPISKYIQKITLNMERCRWLDPQLTNSSEYLWVNIPSFKLIYQKDGKTVLESNVVVGQDIMQTVIFSRCVNAIVFSPYWYVPKSIIENEMISAMKKDKNYLESHNMEWNNGNVRQKPGPKNAMGLVKFVFPNEQDIYLHDTPSKVLFTLEYRAYSHGCINLEKSRELAHLILKDNSEWSDVCIDEAMQDVSEIYYPLPKEIPIHITYFTAWVDDRDVLHFYEDVYSKDTELANELKKP